MIKINKHDRRACCSAFLLFVFTGVLTLSVLVGALFGNPARMVRSLGGDTYVDGLYTEVHQYAADLCLEYGLDTAVADAVTKDGVRTAVQTYAGVMLKSKDRSAKLAPALQDDHGLAHLRQPCLCRRAVGQGVRFFVCHRRSFAAVSGK